MRAEGVALARGAVRRIASHSRCQRVSEEAGLAALAVEAGRIIDAAETLPGDPVAVPDCAQVNVVGTVALSALLSRAL